MILFLNLPMKSTPDLNNLFPHFRKSMDYLLKKGNEFAEKYPSVARELNFAENKVDDPHVQRILESFAFFDARLQWQIDDQLSFLSSFLLDSLYPQFMAPFPSCTIVHFESKKNISNQKNIKIPKHTKISANNKEDILCDFITSQEITVNDFNPKKISYMKTEDTELLESQNYWCLSLETENMKSFKNNSNVVFYINSDLFSAKSLYEHILGYHPTEPTPIYLSDKSGKLLQKSKIGVITPKGFGEDESLIDRPIYTSDSHRLLMEYNIFPHKFLFLNFEINNLNVNLEQIKGDIAFLIPLSKRTKPSLLPMSDNILMNNCCPAVNLFEQKSEPLRLDYEKDSYKIMSDRFDSNSEIHTIKEVFSYKSSFKNNRKVYYPYFSFSDIENGSERSFWYSRREKEDKGSKMMISFIDEDLDVEEYSEETVYADLLCTNRDKAQSINYKTSFQFNKIDNLSCVNILKPTEQVDPQYGGQSQWEIISNLSLNHVDLSINNSDIKPLRKMLEIYNFNFNQKYNEVILGIKHKKTIARMPNSPWTGSVPKIVIDLKIKDEVAEHFMLGKVLSCVISNNVGFNTLLEMRVFGSSNDDVPWKKWEVQN
ncbi:type VI secretion system baseplate subunit TssF [Candidatus Nesciobacter abundans]|uniref:Type VI secretion system baseplate subunit TssF n=1 Tax=Candidatus Nesciobacter abundans TaxID=2601668 RepID=A0A5C0UHB4_9PROT|nr:type VI secretion system baseplate subunit TssF [Candidatus Nesciobacter abundans]QEK39139.1 type VI secretion system baseplate subunit TssF [Candidatus Nesciobacter abundans]